MTRIKNKFDLTGKVAIIAGSSKGIGESIARGFAEHGAKVVISSRKQEAVDAVAASFQKDGLEAIGIACHVGDEEQLKNLVEKTIEKYGDDVLVIFKELPILDDRTKTSRTASKAALAAARQGKYSSMHFALMEAPRLSGDLIRDTAESIGLDMRKFDADMADPSIESHIEDTLLLAERIPDLTGTPFFIVNDEFVSGANTPRLQELVEAGVKG